MKSNLAMRLLTAAVAAPVLLSLIFLVFPLRKAMLEAMEAWNSDIHFLYTAGDNYFPTTAQAQGKTIVTIMCSTGERYLSTALFEQE